MVLLFGLSGCLSAGEDNGGAVTQAFATMPLGRSPLIINETWSALEVTWAQSEGCPWHEAAGTIQVYDRFGLVDSVEYAFDWRDPVEVRTVRLGDLSGTAPWAIAARFPPCGISWESNVTGYFDGFYPHDHMDSLRYWERYKFDLFVPPGEQRAIVFWEPSEHVYGLLQAFPDSANRSGEGYGTVLFYNPDGALIRTDRYGGLAGDSGVEYDPYYYIHGQHRVELVLSRPAVLPTTWPYILDAMQNNGELCAYGFEWDICGTTAS